MENRPLSRLLRLRPRFLFERRRAWPVPPEEFRIDGDRVWLRWPRLTDVERVFSYAADPEVAVFMDWSPHRGIEDSRRFILAAEKARHSGRELALGIIDRQTEDLVGICSLVSKSDPAVAEIGYALCRRYWGQGIMTETVRMICPWAFSTLNLIEIYAEVHPDNVGSQRVLEKSGFVREIEMHTRNLRGVSVRHYRYRHHR